MEKIRLFLILVAIASNLAFSQNFNYYFSKDSLSGFDFDALNQILSKYPNSSEIKEEFSFISKRNFINWKYNLEKEVVKEKYKLQEVNKTSMISTCNNEDFEASPASVISNSNEIQGWSIFNGVNGAVAGVNCTLTNSSYWSTPSSAIINAANYVDPNIGGLYTLYSVFGSTVNGGNSINPQFGSSVQMSGNSFLRLGNTVTGDYSTDEVFKGFKVTPNNPILRYAYIYVGNNNLNHACCDAAQFRVSVKNVTTNSLLTNFDNVVRVPSNNTCTVGNDQFYISGTNNPYTATVTTSNGHTKWRIVDLDFSNYMGDSMVVDFLVVDCTAGAHFGYAYLDAQCSSALLYVNGNTISSYTACNSVTLSATSNFTYSWNGPNTNNVNTQSVIVNTSGIYSLTISSGTLSLGTKTVNITIKNSSPIVAMADNYTICTGGISNLSVVGNGLVTYTWSNGSNNPVTSVSPTITTMYSVTVTNSVGCVSTGLIGINVFDCTSLQDEPLTERQIDVYPNPNSGSFVITSKIEGNVQVYNNLGMLIQTLEFNQRNDFKCSVTGFKQGLYILKGLGFTKKIIVSD